MTSPFLPGDVCVQLGNVLPKNIFQRIKMQIVYYFIRRYQKRQFPGSPRTDAIHVVWLRRLDGRWQSMTYPRCVRLEQPFAPGENVRFYRWKGFEKATPEAWAAFNRACDQMLGMKYSIGKLVDMKLRQDFGWTPDEFRPLDSRKRLVCSTAAMLAIYEFWRALPPGPFHDRCFPKPTTTWAGDYIRLEDVSPAVLDGNLPGWFLLATQNS